MSKQRDSSDIENCNLSKLSPFSNNFDHYLLSYNEGITKGNKLIEENEIQINSKDNLQNNFCRYLY